MIKRQILTWKKRKRNFFKGIIVHIILIASSALFVIPFYWLVSTSFKSDVQIFVYPPNLFPYPLVWENYPQMLNYLPFFHFFFNSSFVTGMNILGVLLSCPLIAYSFARLRFRGRGILFVVLLSTMMLPYNVKMVPLYLFFNYLGWIDTFKPLWVPSFFGVAFYIFLLRQFFMTMPRELEDAAKIDGCSYFGIYWRIMLPLIKPALATVSIFTFQAIWNDFIGPLIYLNSVDKLTLAVGLQMFKTLHTAEWGLLMAAATFMTLPMVIVFFFSQKYFIQGITLTGMKG